MIVSVLERLGVRAARTERMSGYDAQVWRAELTDGRTVAVRILRRGVSSHDEVAALKLAGECGHCVPDVVATVQHEGHDVVVMTWCPGRTIGDLLVEGGDTDDLGRLFGRAQARLHRPLDDRGRALCHLDFQPFNVLVDNDAVSGIVDWSNARVDDPRTDLAWTRVVLDFAPALVSQFASIGGRFVAAWRAGYSKERPMPSDADLAPFLAVAARRQLADWTPRVASGACPPHVLDAVQEIVRSFPS